MKNLIISGLFLYPQQVGGAEKFFYNLLEGIKKTSKFNSTKLIVNPDVLDQMDPIVKDFELIKSKINLNRVINDSFLPLSRKIEKDDIIYYPNYVSHVFPLKNKCVTTIHDLLYDHHPKSFSGIKRAFQNLAHRNALSASDKVISISDFVKDDILRKYGKKYKRKVETIYNPINFDKLDSLIAQDCKSKLLDNGPFIVSVAAQWPNKNILTLIKAFKEFGKSHPEYKLYLIGQLGKNLKGGNFKAYSEKIFDELKEQKNIITTGYVSDLELAHLYHKCQFAIFPSIFEGFGMPAVEALGLGKPVICSNTTALAEVTLGEALYVNDPLDYSEFVKQMEFLHNNLELETQRVKISIDKFRSTFSPEPIANQYIKIFEGLV